MLTRGLDPLADDDQGCFLSGFAPRVVPASLPKKSIAWLSSSIVYRHLRVQNE
jgi:hypothetical protein